MKEYEVFLIWVKGLKFVLTGEPTGPAAYDLEGAPAPRLPDRGPIIAALLKLQQAQEGSAEATDKFSRHGPIGALSTITGPMTVLARTPVLEVVKRFQADFSKLPILLSTQETLWSYLLRRSSRPLRPEQLKQGFWFAVMVLEWWSRPLRESAPSAPQPVAVLPPPPPRRGASALQTACEGYATKRGGMDEWTARFDYTAEGKLEGVSACILGKEGKPPSDALALTTSRDTWLHLVTPPRDGKPAPLDWLLLLDGRTVEVAQRNNNGLGPKRSALRVVRPTVRSEFDLDSGEPSWVVSLTEGVNLPPDAFDRLCNEQAATGVVVHKTPHDVLVFRPSALLMTVAKRLPVGPLSTEEFEATNKALDALGPHRRELS